MTNILLNGIDVKMEVATLYSAFTQSDYAQVGRYMAKITGDLLGKSPIKNSWSYQNSETIKYKI